MNLNVGDYEWLLSAAGQSWLETARRFEGGPLALVTELRKTLSQTQAHLIAEQSELRRRAAQKFPWADCMLFTRLGLEQATGEAIAVFKGARFGNFERTADLCSGIGGDLIGLSKKTLAAGYDRDPLLVKLCQHNLSALGYDIPVARAEASQVDVARVDAWHIDPDRRASGRRTIDPAHYSPTLSEIERLIVTNPHAAIKLAPAATFAPPIDQHYHLEWLGQGRECQQQVAWFGDLATQPGRRTATVLDEHGVEIGCVVGSGHERADLLPLSRYLIEPHAAVIAAGLVSAFAQQQAIHRIDQGVAYLTSEHPVHACGAGCFDVVLAIPFDDKTLRAELKSRDLRPLEVKKRGVQTEIEPLARRLRGDGQIPCTLILTPLRGQTFAVIAERVTAQAEGRGL